MLSMGAWVDDLDRRLKIINNARHSQIPPERYTSASVLLEKLQEPYRALVHKHRFAMLVTGSTANVKLADVRENMELILQTDYQRFVGAYLGKSSSNLGPQVNALGGVIASLIQILDGHVDTFKAQTMKQFTNAKVQVNLFKALGLEVQVDVDKTVLRFTMLMRRYEDKIWSASFESDWKAIHHDLAELHQKLVFDERVGLSKEALQFVRRVLAGGSQAPSLLELTADILSEIQTLKEFSGNVKVTRGA